MMNQRLLVIWAVSATLVAISAVSFSLGKIAGQNAALPTVSGSVTEMAVTDPRHAQDNAAPAYAVPDMFADAASQWRSAVGKKAEGYAALFDPYQRKVIIETCTHTGYRLDEQGEPLPQGEFCEPVLWGQLLALDEKRALVVDRQGQQQTLELKLDRSGDAPTLALMFADHRMTLMPGSKNDLMQALEQHDEVATRKARYLTAIASPRRASLETDAARQSH